jgi:hypothetical protein
MKRLATLLKKDMILGVKDIFVILEIVFAVVMLMILLFIVPEDPSTEAAVFINDETGTLSGFIDSLEIDVEDEMGEFFVDSREEVVQGLVDNPSAIGLVITAGEAGKYNVDLLTQPYTQDALVEYLALEMEDIFSIIAPPAGRYPADVYGAVRIEALQTGLRDEIPFNQRLLPIVLMFMVGIMGLFIMVSVMGQERGDQTIRAFRVSPSGLWGFMASKHLLVLLTGITTFSILYLPMMGTSGYLPSLLLMVLTVVFGSCIGLILAAWFDNPMGSIGWVLLLMLVFNLPSISLLAPVFSPGWIRAIPSYWTLFGLDAAMFPDNNSHLIWQSAAILAVVAAGMYLLSGYVFSRRVRREN